MEKINQKLSEYGDYFEDIRKKIYKLTVIFILFFVVGFLEAGNILRHILSFFNLQNASIVTTSPFQFISLATKIGAYTGLLVCLPVIIYFIYDFLKAGLNAGEKRLFFILLPVGLFLFFLGFFYSYTILYFYLTSVSSLNLAFGIQNIWDINSFLSQIILASALLGVVFEFPIVLTFLIRVGLLNVDALREKRIFAYAGMFVFVGFLPPPDVFSTLLQALPLIVIYEMTIAANAAFGRKSLAETGEECVPPADIVHTAP